MKQKITNCVEDFKAIYSTTKVIQYLSSNETTPHELKLNVVYEHT